MARLSRGGAIQPEGGCGNLTNQSDPSVVEAPHSRLNDLGAAGRTATDDEAIEV